MRELGELQNVFLSSQLDELPLIIFRHVKPFQGSRRIRPGERTYPTKVPVRRDFRYCPSAALRPMIARSAGDAYGANRTDQSDRSDPTDRSDWPRSSEPRV